jgi:LemA protein
MEPLIIIGVVILIIVIIALLINNSFIKANNKVKEAFSTMDIYLKKRWDLIPNIVETVKGYAKHEKDTLTKIVELRNSNYDNLSVEEKLQTNTDISSKLSSVMILSESYPELKASENFKKLSEELSKVEDEIAYSRKYYNATIRDLNNKIEMFPTNLFAKLFGYKQKEMFEATTEERNNVKIGM